MSKVHKKGFTLIELLVVISIISLLSSVVLSAVNDARAKARDTALIGAAQELQKAVELYYHDNGVYPPQTPQYPSMCTSSYNESCYTSLEGANTENVLKSALVPAYMSTLPSPGDFSNPEKNNNPTSRLMYRRITNPVAISGAGCTAAAGNCYAILLYTEKNTNISTANTSTYLLSNGTIRKTYSNAIY